MKPSRREYSTVCPLCNPINYYSGKELAVKEHLDSIGVSYVEHNKTLIKPLELDFYIESENVAIEVDGVYFHNEDNKPKDYHINKTNLCNDRGIRLIHIWEHFLDFRRELIFRIIDKVLNKSEHRFIDSPVIKFVDSSAANSFHKENNVYGAVKHDMSFGMYDDDILLSVISVDIDADNYNITIKRFTDTSYCILDNTFYLFVEYLKNLYFKYSIVINVCRDLDDLSIYEREGFVQTEFKNTYRNMLAETYITDENKETVILEIPRISRTEHRYNKCYDSGTITYKLTFNS